MENNKKSHKLWIALGVILVVVIASLVFINSAKAPEGVSEANITDTSSMSSSTAASNLTVSDLKFQFTGYGPGGKTEGGTFKTITPSQIGMDENGYPVSGFVTFDASTVSTGLDGLDKHLCSADFFDCATYPTITFTFKGATDSKDGTYEVTGALNFHGVVKDITFEVNQNEDLVEGDFLLDTAPFNVKYTGVDNKVRINFSFKATK